MKVRKFVNDKDSLRAAGIKFIQSSKDIKIGYRAAIVNMALGGISKKELSLSSGESVGTINNWIKRADIYGFESLALSLWLAKIFFSNGILIVFTLIPPICVICVTLYKMSACRFFLIR